MIIPPRRNTFLSAKTRSTKASKSRVSYQKTTPRIYDCSKRFTYETTNLPSTPERNAANSQTFYSKNYFILFLSYSVTGSLHHTIRFYSYLYLIIYPRYFIPTFFPFSHVFTFVQKPQAEYFFLSLVMP